MVERGSAISPEEVWWDMSVWISNLRLALSQRPVVLLHGNVRDRYIDEDGNIYRDLTQLLYFLATTSRVNNQACFSDMLILDPVEGERCMAIGRGDVPPTASSSGRCEDTSDPRPPVDVLKAWANQLSSSADEGCFAVVNYLDKLVPFQPSYGENEQQCLLWIEKTIENLDMSHRLVLVALQDSMFPYELYMSSPKCRVLRVPMPDPSDRSAYLKNDLRGHPQLDLISQLTDGMYLRELDRIASDVRDRESLTDRDLRSLVNLHRVGVEQDHWGEISLEKLDTALDWFVNREGVKGQNEAIEKIMDALIVARAGLSGLASGARAKPRGVFFFAGPTGVGKTYIAKKLAKFLFNNEEAFIRLDMSEFKEEHTISRLLGSPPGYIGSERGGMLTNAVREKPFSVVLFDEIEKANPRIMDLFLQMLDEGRLTDSRGQTVFFTETLIVLTSNVGNRTKDFHGRDIETQEHAALEEIRLGADPGGTERARRIRDHFIRCVERFFRDELSRPELLGRIGSNIVPFNLLDDRETQLEIVQEHIRRISDEVAERLSKAGNRLLVDPAVAEFLVDAYQDAWEERGARGITDTIGSELVARIAKLVLSAELKDASGLVLKVSVDRNVLEARIE
jgi:hypothetical protein